METFTEIKEFLPNPEFVKQRRKALKSIDYKHIDNPIVDIIKRLNELPYFFTLQCCYEHFLYAGQTNEYNLDPIPKSKYINEIEYRIAYMAFCIQENSEGKELLTYLKDISKIDPQNIQFGCADWFWERQINSFALQVEPDRFKIFDKAILEYEEALYIENLRKQFFKKLSELNRIKIQMK